MRNCHVGRTCWLEWGTYTGCGDRMQGKRKICEDIPGFCFSAKREQIAEHGNVLTPVRYVGAEEVEEDDEPFEEKMARLTQPFAETKKLEKAIRKNLQGLGYAR